MADTTSDREKYGSYQDHLDHVAVRGQNAAARKKQNGTLAGDKDYSEKDIQTFKSTFGLDPMKDNTDEKKKSGGYSSTSD